MNSFFSTSINIYQSINQSINHHSQEKCKQIICLLYHHTVPRVSLPTRKNQPMLLLIVYHMGLAYELVSTVLSLSS